jgi:PKD repeat protein
MMRSIAGELRSARVRRETMKKLVVIGVLFGALVTVTSEAAAQPRGEMIAYDDCQPDFGGLGDGWVICDMFLMSEGIPITHIGDGVDGAWSPDGSRLAFGGNREPGIFVLNLGDWSRTKILNGGWSPTWSPDGTKLAIAAGELYVINADGSGATQLTSSVGFIGQPDWSPDGATIAFDCEVESGNRDICSINADGTGFVRLTSDPELESGPAFSPDGLTIAFMKTSGEYGQYFNVAFMNSNGTGVSLGFGGSDPSWSPDGTTVAFGCSIVGEAFAGDPICHGRNVPSVADARGNRPAWALSVKPVAWWPVPQPCREFTCTFDGSGSWGGNSAALSYTWNFGDGTSDTSPTPTHVYAAVGTYSVTLTVTDDLGIASTQTRVLEVVNNPWPTASFTYVCRGRQCSFDGRGSSDPDGPIVSYFWSFGDGGTSSADTTVSHTYQADGTFTVSLTVADGAGGTGTQQQVVNVTNAPPLASFTPTCIALTCTVDASGSSDPDGTIASYAWNFGDATTGSAATATHTYAAGGTYTVTLTVTDNGGATSTRAQSVAVVPSEIHLGDLDGASTSQAPKWTATVTITVHDSSHGLVADAQVSGSWNNGDSGSCTTNTLGQCAVSRSGILKTKTSVSFTVTNVARAPLAYKAADNHDPDGDSNGISITVSKP